jgi:hypothetical protein
MKYLNNFAPISKENGEKEMLIVLNTSFSRTAERRQRSAD